MGFNTTVVILNDALHEIANDPSFGKQLANACMKVQLGSQNISAGMFYRAATAIETHHADVSSLILVGGNCATVVHEYACGWEHDTEEAQLHALKAFAKKLGYKVSKLKA
jgi:hypothetical protein